MPLSPAERWGTEPEAPLCPECERRMVQTYGKSRCLHCTRLPRAVLIEPCEPVLAPLHPAGGPAFPPSGNGSLGMATLLSLSAGHALVRCFGREYVVPRNAVWEMDHSPVRG